MKLILSNLRSWSSRCLFCVGYVIVTLTIILIRIVFLTLCSEEIIIITIFRLNVCDVTIICLSISLCEANEEQ